jgi:hypothetical protein
MDLHTRFSTREEGRRGATAREEFEVACSSGSRLEMCSAAATPVRGRGDFPFFFSLSLSHFFYAYYGGRWEEAATPRMPVRCRRPGK